MEEKRTSGRSKRQKIAEEGCWDCSVCTYKNSPEAYKCEMCDVRKGTSTRKPRLNASLVAQQGSQQFASPQPQNPLGPPPPPGVKKEKANSTLKKEEKGVKVRKVNRSPRLKNIDRSTARHMHVTVGSVTVVITDYQPKKSTPVDAQSNISSVQSDTSDASSTASNELLSEHAVEENHV
ncbi:hypothetical protein ACJMK2_015938 [Sinanodonta woodiana]|uniref:RanBP2-type domain-containing protein n=1 Tax=Sinanodonta woodiana TaxID=1069815 RepID=A0ABD3US05_SINWO